jgi:sugar lactone lactonase YvrE
MAAWMVNNTVGESPLWHTAEHALYWIDVREQLLLRLTPETQLLTRWQLPEVVGAAGFFDDRTLYLSLQHRVAEFDCVKGTLREVAMVEPHHPCNRLNDGKVSPSRRWYVFGSMHDRPEREATGALYCMSRSGVVTQLVDGLAVCNGIAWSHDGATLYFSDSHRGLIWRASWSEAAGTMGNVRLFATLTDATGRPDGACVDRTDTYWSAGVSAGVLNRFDANGAQLSSLPLPCRAPTMMCFAGDDESIAYVTSLVRPTWRERHPFDGALIELSFDRMTTNSVA